MCDELISLLKVSPKVDSLAFTCPGSCKVSSVFLSTLLEASHSRDKKRTTRRVFFYTRLLTSRKYFNDLYALKPSWLCTGHRAIIRSRTDFTRLRRKHRLSLYLWVDTQLLDTLYIRTAISTCAGYFICISLCPPPLLPLHRSHTELRCALCIYFYYFGRTPSCSCAAPYSLVMFYRWAIVFFKINCAIINAYSEKIPWPNTYCILFSKINFPPLIIVYVELLNLFI